MSAPGAAPPPGLRRRRGGAGAGWVAGTVRARSLARRRLGAGAARRLATSSSLDDAVATLAATPYGHGVRVGQDLAAAERGLVETLLWHLRVLGGWLPRDGAAMLRLLAGWFEIANVEELLQRMAGRPAGEPLALGALATAWPRCAQARSPAELRATLATSPWGDPGGETLRDVQLGMRLSWAERLAAASPGRALGGRGSRPAGGPRAVRRRPGAAGPAARAGGLAAGPGCPRRRLPCRAGAAPARPRPLGARGRRGPGRPVAGRGALVVAGRGGRLRAAGRPWLRRGAGARRRGRARRRRLPGPGGAWRSPPAAAGRWRSSMRWRDRLGPVPMQRVALVAPVGTPARRSWPASPTPAASSSTADRAPRTPRRARQGAASSALGRAGRTRWRRRCRHPTRTSTSWSAPAAGTCSPARRSWRNGPRGAVVRGSAAALAGWAVADAVPGLAARLAESGGAVVPLPRPRGVDPPTLLRAAGRRRSLTPLVETYGTVPYADVDPTVLAAAGLRPDVRDDVRRRRARRAAPAAGGAACAWAGRGGWPASAGLAVRRRRGPDQHRLRPAVRRVLRADRRRARPVAGPAGGAGHAAARRRSRLGAVLLGRRLRRRDRQPLARGRLRRWPSTPPSGIAGAAALPGRWAWRRPAGSWRLGVAGAVAGAAVAGVGLVLAFAGFLAEAGGGGAGAARPWSSCSTC